MTSPRTICLTGARGGSGTSTVAAALALLAARHHPTELVAPNVDDMAALLGLPSTGNPETLNVAPQLDLRLCGGSGVAELVVIDAGSHPEACDWPDGSEHYLVVRGPCYLALRAVVRSDPVGYDGAILVTEPGRSLTAADVAEVLGFPVVAEVPQNPAISRAVDAGLLAARIDRLSPLAALATLAASPPRRCAARRSPTRLSASTSPPLPTQHPSERTPEKSGTDWPCPLFSGHGGRGPGRDTRIGVARGRISRPTGGHHRVEHRQVATRCRRLLRRRGREVTGRVLPRPR